MTFLHNNGASRSAFMCCAFLIALLASCGHEVVDEEYAPVSTHADYERSLDRLGLLDTELGSRWMNVADAALSDPVIAELPFREVAYFDPSEPAALGYRFTAVRGRQILISIDTGVDSFFADVLRRPDRPDDAPVPVASRPPDGRSQIVFESRTGGDYLLRIQPQLLQGGRFEVTITERASLAFPVEGVGPEAIWSYYGDPRDSGARVHEGVDIFAPRGTPLLAASDSVVLRVGWRDRGGNVVSLHDEARDIRLYYAHLDTQLVTEGQRVSAGDVIGTVGNTGNAASTPPHLHLGVYASGWSGSVDPWDYLVDPPPAPVPQPEFAGEIGGWYILSADADLSRIVPSPATQPRFVNRNPILRRQASVPAPASSTAGQVSSPAQVVRAGAQSAVRVMGATRGLVRVRTAGGFEGVVPASLVRSPSETLTFGTDAEGHDPLSGEPVVRISAGSTADYLGSDGGSGLVARLPDGRVVIVSQAAL